MEGVQAQIQEDSPGFPDHLLVGLNDQNPQFHSIYRINLGTGDRELVQQNDGFAGFITDEDFNAQPRFCQCLERPTMLDDNKIKTYYGAYGDPS